MGSVLIDNGVILDVGPNVFVDAMQDDIEVIDCLGVCLCPGLIDMRVATGEPGNEHLETFDSVSNSAAAGGITSIICLPNTDPTIDDVALLEFVERRGAEVDLVSVRSYAAATKGTLGLEMSEKKSIIKLFEDLTEAENLTKFSSLGADAINSYASGGFDFLMENLKVKPENFSQFLVAYGELLS